MPKDGPRSINNEPTAIRVLQAAIKQGENVLSYDPGLHLKESVYLRCIVDTAKSALQSTGVSGRTADMVHRMALARILSETMHKLGWEIPR